jgi:flagellar biosynthesis/type III secretory pathway protein FliH
MYIEGFQMSAEYYQNLLNEEYQKGRKDGFEEARMRFNSANSQKREGEFDEVSYNMGHTDGLALGNNKGYHAGFKEATKCFTADGEEENEFEKDCGCEQQSDEAYDEGYGDGYEDGYKTAYEVRLDAKRIRKTSS